MIKNLQKINNISTIQQNILNQWIIKVLIIQG